MNRIIEKIKNIDETYKKSFYIICVTAFFVFFREIIFLKWGDHDCYSMLNSVSIDYGWFEGRFLLGFLNLLMGFKCITYISNTLYLLGLISGLMLLTKYWEIPKKISNIVLFVLFYLLMPSTLCFMYYKVESINFGFGLFFTVLSILTALKINKTESIKEKIIYFIMSYVLLFVFVLGSYQPFINMIFVLLSGKMLLNYIESGFKISSIKEYIKEHKYFFIVFVLSVISEFLIIEYLKFINRFEVHGNSSLINFLNFQELKDYLILSLKLMYELLFKTFPYMGMYVKVLLFIVVLSAFVFMLIKIFRIKQGVANKLKTSLIFVFLFILTVWLSLFSYFIASGYDFGNILLRVNHIGYDFIYLLCFAILIKFVKSGIFKKAVIVLSVLIIYNFGINTIYAQQISDMAFNAEMQFQNRVLARIEKHPDFSYDKEYKYIKIGYHKSFKDKFYVNNEYNYFCYEFISHVFYNSISFNFFTFYNLSIDDYISHFLLISDYLKDNDIPGEIKDYILNKAKIWPDNDSVYVTDKYIVVVFDEEVLERSREILLEKRKVKNEQDN